MLKDKSEILTNQKVIFSLSYLPPLDFYMLFNKAEKVFIEQYEYYQKQSYRNRCVISTANGAMSLIIPVEKSGKVKIKDVKISGHSDWQTLHWRSIEAAYNSSPFFEYYSDDFRMIFEKKWVFLWDFSFELFLKTIELLSIEKEFTLTDSYITETDGIFDARNLIHPKKELLFSTPEYYQVFSGKNGFKAGLSILDLLFNMGNESQLYI